MAEDIVAKEKEPAVTNPPAPVIPQPIANPPAPAQPAQPTHPAQASQPQGPLDRFMDPYMKKVITTVTPNKYKDSVLNSYSHNRTLYNLAALALLGGIGTGLYRGARGMFGGHDDGYRFDPHARRWYRGGYGGGGGFFGNVGSFLLPMALLAGGGYLWNKYGDKVIGGVKNISGGLDDLKEARELWAQNKDNLKTAGTNIKEMNEFWDKNKATFQRGVDTIAKVDRAKKRFGNIPIIGPAAKKIWHWVTD